jgi:hypothetical protein
MYLTLSSQDSSTSDHVAGSGGRTVFVRLDEPNVSENWEFGRDLEAPAIDEDTDFCEVGVLEGGCGAGLGLRNHSDPSGGLSGAVTTSPKKESKIPGFSRRVIGTASLCPGACGTQCVMCWKSKGLEITGLGFGPVMVLSN